MIPLSSRLTLGDSSFKCSSSLVQGRLKEEFQRLDILTYDVQAVVDTAIDSVISTATTEFVAVQSSATKDALEKSEVSNQDLEHFAAIAAHDLKSPLATISGYLDLLAEEFKDGLGKEGLGYVNVMQRTSGRMLNLVDRLLDYSKVSKIELNFQPTDLAGILAAASQNLSLAIEETKAQITHDNLPVVTGDSDFLTQVFQNLIGNSLKFHGKNPPQIHVRAESKDDRWLISVSDNGIGFDPKNKEDIFALYRKLNSSEYQGAGIGLATCRKVVELHGGRIWAESTPGAGSIFFFTLPKNKPNADTYH